MMSPEDKINDPSPRSIQSSDRRSTYNSIASNSNSGTPLYSGLSSVSSSERIDPSILGKNSNNDEQNANANSYGGDQHTNLNVHTDTDTGTDLRSLASSNTTSPQDLALLQSDNLVNYSSSNRVPPKPNTSVSSTVKDSSGNVVKRKYSRNGCTECKRRRMKCDETKPTCWQCSRLNRHCIYVFNPKNKKRKSEPSDSDNAFKPKKPDNTILSPRKSKNKKLSEDFNEYSTDMQVNAQMNSPVSTGTDHNNTSSSNLGIDQDGSLNYNANLLIQNLNDIVNMKLHDSFSINEDLKDLESFDLNIPELLNGGSPSNSVPISFQMKNLITFNTELTSLKLDKIHEKYLRAFYYDCMDSIAPFFQDQGNPLRDIILSFAKSESYLLSAVLAVGASICHRESEDLEDEKNYCQYLSHCLKFLDEQFQNESNVIEKIEPIILTVILLAWDCIYTMNSQWRSHLKGIIDLFKKINAGNSSKVLNVAKSWFKIMETFASISTNFGGSLTDESDIDLIFNPYDYQYTDSLKYLNIMTPLNEFNLLRGHKEDFDIVIKEVIKALNKIRLNQKKRSDNNKIITGKLINLPLSFQRTIVGPGNETSDKEGGSLSYFTIQKILVEIDKQLDYEFINKTGIIPIASQSHPKNSEIEDNAIDSVILKSGEEIAISWYDISHQTQVLSFLLIVLLKLLNIPKQSIIIQEVVRKIMSFFKFLDSENPPKNGRTCYSNFAVLIAGLNAIDEDTKNLIRRYYLVNTGSRFSRLSEHSLIRLEKVWAGDLQSVTNQDILTW